MAAAVVAPKKKNKVLVLISANRGERCCALLICDMMLDIIGCCVENNLKKNTNRS